MTQQSDSQLFIYPREIKTYVHTKTCMLMFTAHFSQWPKHRSNATGEWLNTVWHIHTMEHHSTTNRNKVLLQYITWMNLRKTILSEKSQTQKTTFPMVLFV